MIGMGIASMLIGLVPPTAQIGIAAPIALIVLRIIQGLAVGGEWGGAILVSLENAPHGRRAFWAGLSDAGGPAGAALATLSLTLFSLLPNDQFLSWGWRVPFLASAVLVILGLVIRLKVKETPMFRKIVNDEAKARVPALDVIRHHWLGMLIGGLAVLAFTTSQGLMTVWGVSVAVEHGASSTGVLIWRLIGSVTTMLVAITSARLCGRFGRRPMLLIGMGLGVILAFPVVGLLYTGTVWGFGLATLLGNGLVQGTIYGGTSSFLTEQFPTRLRYTGASLSYQTASTLGSGLSPLAATALTIAFGAGWAVSSMWIVVLVVAAIAVFIAPERRDTSLIEIDAIADAQRQRASRRASQTA